MKDSNNNNIEIKFGQIINIECKKIESIFYWVNNSSKYDVIPCEVKKYRQSDVVPKYKVNLSPMVEGYWGTSIYVSDLKQLIRSGDASIRLDV